MLLKILGAVIALCVAASASAAAESNALPTEYQVKAAILFNIAKFLEWPEGTFRSPSSPIIIGILGEDPFGSALNAARDRTVGGRKVLIKRFARVEDVTGCHILFISQSEKRKLTHILLNLGDRVLLLVGDSEEFAQRGVMISLVLEKEAVIIEINVEALNRVGLKVNSRLLNIARIVHSNRHDMTQ